MNIEDRPHILENFKWPYLCNGSADPLHVYTATIICPRTIYHLTRVIGDISQSVIARWLVVCRERNRRAAFEESTRICMKSIH